MPGAITQVVTATAILRLADGATRLANPEDTVRELLSHTAAEHTNGRLLNLAAEG